MGGQLHRHLTRAIALLAAAIATATLADAATAAPVGAPRNARATHVGTTWVSLRWKAVAGARGYVVARDGRAVLRVRTAHATDATVPQGTAMTFTVRAVDGRGRASRASLPVPVTTPVSWACTRMADADTGSDAGPGTPARPFRTVQQLANALAPGTVGCLRGSFAQDVTVRTAGAAGNPAVLRSAPGTRASLQGRLWIADSANFLVVQDLDLDGRNVTPGDLPSPTVEGDHVTFVRDDVTSNHVGICFILGSVRGYGAAVDTVLDGNRIHDCGALPANNHRHGIYLENSQGARITNNVIYANADRGIQLYPNAQGTLVARNVLDGNGEGVIFSGALGYASSGNRVVDNVVANSLLRYNLEHFWPEGNPVGTGNVAARNCLWNGHDGNVSEPTVGFTATANVVADPAFADRASGDFRPTARSACRELFSGAAPLAPQWS